jgi:hypothetical protein
MIRSVTFTDGPSISNRPRFEAIKNVEFKEPQGHDLPEDPCGREAARFLTTFLDGLTIKVEYGEPDSFAQRGFNSMGQAAVGSRVGPGKWETLFTFNLTPTMATVYAAGGLQPKLPTEIVNFAQYAVQAAGDVGITAGFDGRTLPPAMARALQESIVAEIITQKLMASPRAEAAHEELRDRVLQVLQKVMDTSQQRVEGVAMSHGVVLLPYVHPEATSHDYPSAYSQKRTALMFDGQRTVLVVDAAGKSVFERSRAHVQEDYPELYGSLDQFEEDVGLHGSLVAFVSRREEGGVGFYVHPDQTIWVYADGSPVMVKRGNHWLAVPFVSLTAGVSSIVGSDSVARLICDAAIHLSLVGHGAILAVVQGGKALPSVVSKDLINHVGNPPTKEQATHALVRRRNLAVEDLVRLASIDGATILDDVGNLIAYAAVVLSGESKDEGARTAAARSLSKDVLFVIKVSEDGPMTFFRDGEELGRLLE